MATARSSNPGGNASVDAAPLLGTQNGGRRSGRRGGLLRAAWFFRRTSSRQMMREPSMMVRETAAEHLEERQTDWAYSKPVVFLDILWNLAFVGVAVGVLILSRNETPLMPLRAWIVGYALQCVLHMVCVCIEYRRRHLRGGAILDEEEGGSGRSSASNSPRRVREASENEQGRYDDNPSCIKHLESVNTMFSFIWWIIGFYWVSAGGQALTRDAPQLYWLCIVFLAFDVFFVVFCVALACVIGIAVCCCLPCIIAILYAIADQEGASEDDISQLSKYKFRKIGDSEKIDEISGPFGGIMTECGSDPPIERTLSADDAECCICLCTYEDGVELRGGGGGAAFAGTGRVVRNRGVLGEAQGVRQGVGVQEQRVLLQRDHLRLLPGVPVREPLQQAQHPRGAGRRILGLPLLHHRRRRLPAARLRHHRRQADADGGGRRLPRPRRQQDLVWVRRRHRRPARLGLMLQTGDEPEPVLLRRQLPLPMHSRS